MGELLNRLGIAGIVFISLFFVTTIVELVFAFLVKEKARKIVKPFCLLFLVIPTIIVLPNHPFIYVGLIFGLLGDIILISKKKAMFFLGTISFLIEHILFIVEFFVTFFPLLDVSLPYWVFIIYGIIYLLLVIIFAKRIIKMVKNLPIAIFGLNYMIIIIMLIAISLTATIYQYQYIIITLFGYIIFFVSDTILTLATFSKDIKRRDFYIMLTYLIAQFLIVFGFALTYIH